MPPRRAVAVIEIPLDTEVPDEVLSYVTAFWSTYHDTGVVGAFLDAARAEAATVVPPERGRVGKIRIVTDDYVKAIRAG